MDHTETPGASLTERVAHLLRSRRRTLGLDVSGLAERSEGRFTVERLIAVESGRARIGPSEAAELAALYGIELAAVVSGRPPLVIDPAGTIHAAGATAAYRAGDSTSLLAAYLRVVRQLRGVPADGVVALRRADVAILAEHLGETPDGVVERLAVLLEVDGAERRALGERLRSGAEVVGLAAADSG